MPIASRAPRARDHRCRSPARGPPGPGDARRRRPPGPASGTRAPPSGGSGEPRRAARPAPARPPRLRTPGRLRRRKAARPSRGPQFPVRPRPPAPLPAGPAGSAPSPRAVGPGPGSRRPRPPPPAPPQEDAGGRVPRPPPPPPAGGGVSPALAAPLSPQRLHLLGPSPTQTAGALGSQFPSDLPGRRLLTGWARVEGRVPQRPWGPPFAGTPSPRRACGGRSQQPLPSLPHRR